MSTTTNFKRNDPKVITGWAFFDWANSAYALVITVAIFPGYFMAVTDDEFPVLGIRMTDSALYAFAVSAAYLVLAFASPFLSGIADYGGRKKAFLRFFTTLGSLACLSMYFFTSMKTLPLGTTAFILATIGFAGGLVFYNAYLPLIATEDQYDRVSAKGFSYGYLGSIILLIVNLAVITFYEELGFSEQSFAVRLAFVMVGLWWLGFSQIPFRRLPRDVAGHSTENLVSKGYQELKKVWGSLQHSPNTKRFLIAFFFYNAGVQTVLFLASTFAEKELKFKTADLIILILILQLVAIFGAVLFSRLTDFENNKRKMARMIGIWGTICAAAWALDQFTTLFPWLLPVAVVVLIAHVVITSVAFLFYKTAGHPGNKFSIVVSLTIWMGICLSAYFIQTDLQFFSLAAAVGIVMGGIQSMSRSTYSKLLPENTPDTASWFSFYDVLDKVSTMIGTFGFGFVQLTGGMRQAVLALAVFFAVGLAVLAGVKISRQREVAV